MYVGMVCSRSQTTYEWVMRISQVISITIQTLQILHLKSSLNRRFGFVEKMYHSIPTDQIHTFPKMVSMSDWVQTSAVPRRLIQVLTGNYWLLMSITHLPIYSQERPTPYVRWCKRLPVNRQTIYVSVQWAWVLNRVSQYIIEQVQHLPQIWPLNSYPASSLTRRPTWIVETKVSDGMSWNWCWRSQVTMCGWLVLLWSTNDHGSKMTKSILITSKYMKRIMSNAMMEIETVEMVVMRIVS